MYGVSYGGAVHEFDILSDVVYKYWTIPELASDHFTSVSSGSILVGTDDAGAMLITSTIPVGG